MTQPRDHHADDQDQARETTISDNLEPERGVKAGGAAPGGARKTVADGSDCAASDLGASGTAAGARETVVGAGAEGTAQVAATDLSDAPVPRMPDGPASASAEAAPGGVVSREDPHGGEVSTPALDSAANRDATISPEPASFEPPAGRYASTRKHRVAADTKGRILSESEYKSLSRRSLLTGVVGAAAAFVGWRTLQNRPADDRIPDVLRDVHQANESIWRGLFRDGAEAPTFDYSESSMMRINGRHGIREELDLASWQMVVVGRDGERLGVHGVEELRAMEQIELTVEHKCVEGWAHIVTWGGVRFSDFVERFYPDEASARFVGLATPDNEYRVGLDMDSMLHSQTILALDLQRAPLSDQHGAPVRLATPLKYGIKQIKRIGTIEFSDTQPEGDYWATRGYDWYAGL